MTYPTKWEYQSFNEFDSPDTLTHHLAALGEKGWEVYHLQLPITDHRRDDVNPDTMFGGYTIFAKRPI